MIFADKLILLRKKAGWSQEELAEQMNVTRQSVSKWEGAQSVPDLDKMIRLSELFGVSTDYLLKDEIEQAEHINSSNDMPSLKRVSMEEANAFLSVKSRTAKTIAYAPLPELMDRKKRDIMERKGDKEDENKRQKQQKESSAAAL